jgi:glycosyltransferase involved in cell wall biosynthesis
VKRPTICAVIIARNEERDLPKLLKSLEGVADEIVLVDTGSTDRTVEIAETAGACVMTTHGASESNPDKPGEWRIVNFAKARNIALELAESSGCSHILCVDADDVIKTPLAIRRAAYMPPAVFGIWIELGGGVRQVNHRMWPAEYKIRFHDWVHEWPNVDGRPGVVLNDACIEHDATPHGSAGEDSNARNLRILTKQWAAEPNARCAFYLANTHKDGGRLEEAVQWYMVRLGFGVGFADEFDFSLLYLVRCLESLDRSEEAEAFCRRGIERRPDWQEFRMALAFMLYKRKNYAAAIEEATKALDKPIPETILWREKSMYRDQPARLISWCHEHLGNIAQSFVWSQLASRLIGKPDADWAKREAVLEQRLDAPPMAPAIIKGLRPRVAIHRPGAIGDILMTLNLLPAFREANPGVDLHYYCDAKLAQFDQLGAIIVAAGADAVMDCATVDQFRPQYERVYDLVGYPLAEGYPEKPMSDHLIHYFARELGFKIAPFEGLYSLTIRRPLVYGFARGYATLQTKAGWSKYKQWPSERWAEVVEACDFPIVQLVDSEEEKIDGCEWHRGALTSAVDVFANARMHLGIDSFCNHLTNYLWTYPSGARRVPGVILWGSTQASAAGYPDNINLSAGLACQPCFRENPAVSRMPRGPCIQVIDRDHLGEAIGVANSYDDPRPHACMQAISVEQVVEAARRLWAETG